LNDCQLTETGQDYARRIANAASRMDILIRDLLAYGHLNSANLETSPLNVVPLLEDLTRSWELKNARFTIQKSMPRIQANPIGLKQIFENLIGNATKFVPAGVVPEIRIYAEERLPWVRFNIQDNGIGIDPKY